MPYNREIHHRRSIRQKGYDYSQEGLYLITICIEDRKCLLGEIVVSDINGCKQMILNDAGKMVERWYRELENKYPDKRFDGKLWQRNYYEHIIRSTEEYERIAVYIIDNPAKWQEDKFFNP